MSAPPHDGWPAEGSRWEHWDDLLLACQLAGLRSGWNGISKRWDDTEPTKLVMRCHIGNGSSPSRCHWWILTARAEDSTRLEGAWLVSELRRENLESFRHSGHLGSGNFGISDPHKSPPTKRPKIKLDKIVKGWNKLHLIEASLRVEARKSNRFLRSHTYVSATAPGTYSHAINCVLGERCTFRVRFGPVPSVGKDPNEPKWKCTVLCRTHSCTPYETSPPSALLEKCLGFWPMPRFSRSHCDTVRTLDSRAFENKKSPKTDDHLGPYRLLAAGETLETKFPPPDSILTAKLEPLKLSRSETRKSLSTIETTLRNLRSELALADIMEELDETKRLKEALDSAGQEKEQYPAKLAEIEVKMKGVE